MVILFTTGSKEAVDILTGYLLPAIWMMVIKITLMYDSLLKMTNRSIFIAILEPPFYVQIWIDTHISEQICYNGYV